MLRAKHNVLHWYELKRRQSVLKRQNKPCFLGKYLEPWLWCSQRDYVSLSTTSHCDQDPLVVWTRSHFVLVSPHLLYACRNTADGRGLVFGTMCEKQLWSQHICDANKQLGKISFSNWSSAVEIRLTDNKHILLTVMEEVLRYFTYPKVTIPHCKIACKNTKYLQQSYILACPIIITVTLLLMLQPMKVKPFWTTIFYIHVTICQFS